MPNNEAPPILPGVIVPAHNEADEQGAFLKSIEAMNPQLPIAARFIFDHAPAPLNTASYLFDIFVKQDSVVRLLDDLNKQISSNDLVPSGMDNSPRCDVWSFFGVMFLLLGKAYQALEVFDFLYSRLLDCQNDIGKRLHKGLPLFHMGQCHQVLGRIVHAKRCMMLAMCEDVVTGGGTINLLNTGSYGQLAGTYGLPDYQIRRYAEDVYKKYTLHPLDGAQPEWLLQELDQHWKTEIPSGQEAGVYHVSRNYCKHLLAKLGSGDGKQLERLAEYLVGSMPGCRTYRRAISHSTDYDVIGSVEGAIVDFRSELGRYFVCECKDKKEDKASFSEIAKFCRVLDSVKAKFGIVFSTTGHSGEGKSINADREILKVYQDRGIVIVVVDREDLGRVAGGANFISLLRQKYEIVRLDLR